MLALNPVRGRGRQRKVPLDRVLDVFNQLGSERGIKGVAEEVGLSVRQVKRYLQGRGLRVRPYSKRGEFLAAWEASGHNVRKAAELLGIQPDNVRARLRALGVVKVTRYEGWMVSTNELLDQLYRHHGNASATARALGVDLSTVLSRAKGAGVDLAELRKLRLGSDEQFREAYDRLGSVYRVSRRMGCDHNTARRRLRAMGVIQ